VCVPPAKLNRRGMCECPTDMVAVGNTCIERKRQPQINIPIPGHIPGIGPRGDQPGVPRGNQGPTGGFPGR
jgi:hypothetical protein